MNRDIIQKIAKKWLTGEGRIDKVEYTQKEKDLIMEFSVWLDRFISGGTNEKN